VVTLNTLAIEEINIQETDTIKVAAQAVKQ
jgi:hypothetical protein